MDTRAQTELMVRDFTSWYQRGKWAAGESHLTRAAEGDTRLGWGRSRSPLRALSNPTCFGNTSPCSRALVWPLMRRAQAEKPLLLTVDLGCMLAGVTYVNKFITLSGNDRGISVPVL